MFHVKHRKEVNMAKRKMTQVESEYKKQRRRIQSFIRKHEKIGFHFEENILPAIPKRITKSSVSRLKKITPQKLYSKASYAGEETLGEVVTAYEGIQARKQKAKKTRVRRYKSKKIDIKTPHINKRATKKSDKSTQNGTERTMKGGTYRKKGGKTAQTRKGTPKDAKYNVSTDPSFYTRTVLSGWYGLLETYSNGKAYHMLRMWMNKLIRDNGEDKVAQALEKAAAEGTILVWDVAYKIPLAIEYTGNVMKFLFDSNLERDYYKDQMDDLINFWINLGRAAEEDEDWERPF